MGETLDKEILEKLKGKKRVRPFIPPPTN